MELDGHIVGVIEAGGPYSPSTVRTVPILWFNGLSEGGGTGSQTETLSASSSAQTHSLGISIGDDCEAAGATHFTLDSLTIDMLVAG